MEVETACMITPNQKEKKITSAIIEEQENESDGIQGNENVLDETINTID